MVLVKRVKCSILLYDNFLSLFKKSFISHYIQNIFYIEVNNIFVYSYLIYNIK